MPLDRRPSDGRMGAILPGAIGIGGVAWRDTSPTAELVVSAADPMARCWQCSWKPVIDTRTGRVTAWSLKDIYARCPDHQHLRQPEPSVLKLSPRWGGQGWGQEP